MLKYANKNVGERPDKQIFYKICLFSKTARVHVCVDRSEWWSPRGGAGLNDVPRNVISIKKYSQISEIFDLYVLTPPPILPQRTLRAYPRVMRPGMGLK